MSPGILSTGGPRRSQTTVDDTSRRPRARASILRRGPLRQPRPQRSRASLLRRDPSDPRGDRDERQSDVRGQGPGDRSRPPAGPTLPHGIRRWYLVSDEEVARIPKEGPLVIVANHPFGGLDAMILDDLVSMACPDVRFIANGTRAGARDQGAPRRSVRRSFMPRRNAKSIRKAVECSVTAAPCACSRRRGLGLAVGVAARPTCRGTRSSPASSSRRARPCCPSSSRAGTRRGPGMAGLVSATWTLLLGREPRARNRRVRGDRPADAGPAARSVRRPRRPDQLPPDEDTCRSRLEREEPITSPRMRRILRGTLKGRSGSRSAWNRSRPCRRIPIGPSRSSPCPRSRSSSAAATSGSSTPRRTRSRSPGDRRLREISFPPRARARTDLR